MMQRIKMPGQNFYLYKRPEFSFENCRYVYIGQDNLFEDLMWTLADMPFLSHFWCFVLFQDGTSPDKLINDVEQVLSKITHDGCAIAVDVMSLYSQESEQEQTNILRVMSEYFLCHSAHRHVLVPPIVRLKDMARLSVISSIQTLSNTLNMEVGTPPCWAFRFTMRENGQKRLLQVVSNWTDGGVSLSRCGSKKYMHGVARYLEYSIHAGLKDHHDLSCRIQAVTPEEGVVAGVAPVPGPSAGVSRAQSRSRGSQGGARGGNVSRGRRGGHAGIVMDHQDRRVDGRVQIASRIVARELERLRQLRDYINRDITRRHITVFFNNLSKNK